MINWLMRMLKTPKTQIGFLLTLIFITAFINNPSLKVLVVFLLSLVSTVFFDVLFLRLRKIKWFFPSASLVTGSIIGLLTSPDLSWYAPVAVGIIAMFAKNFIRFSNRHIFNPAGFGLFVSAIIFKQSISWWAVSFQQFSIFHFPSSIYFLVLLSPAFVSIFKMKRYRITFSFLIAYILINKILNSQFIIHNSFLDPTILFFSIVMLPEPMTSPNNHKRQIFFGIFVALLSIIVSSPILNSKFLILNSLDPLVLSLLLGNLVFFKLR
ncbi:RnfABCDGE type electron transport complex subunit D [Candidatus Roizmanbacteria bacterium]|nr:RnfABCDGE type electron transport complex subunit D [Candidatus Roizmanbacteria bacterium]